MGLKRCVPKWTGLSCGFPEEREGVRRVEGEIKIKWERGAEKEKEEHREVKDNEAGKHGSEKRTTEEGRDGETVGVPVGNQRGDKTASKETWIMNLS